MTALTAIDLFAGAGGATQGLKDSGIRVVAAVENDKAAADTYAANHPSVMLKEEDIEQVDPGELQQALQADLGDLFLITACPPCQGFSTLGLGNRSDPRNDLVRQVGRFADEFRPRVVLLENVPGLATDDRYRELTANLERWGYRSESYVVDAADFGVPQKRRRLIQVALRPADAARFPKDLRDALPSDFPLSGPSAAEALEIAGPVEGATDRLHRPRRHSRAVLDRIRAIPQNGGRHDLPAKHRLKCHESLDRHGASTVYSRIRTTGPAPTMTTRCTTPSCGRFVHPTEHRGITLREAALLQSFPLEYQFAGSHQAVERQIGNAIPVRLAQALGHIVQRLSSPIEAVV